MTSNSFLGKVSFVNKISSIMKATSDDDKPVPGYLFTEISNITHESPETCESCLEFLVDRLTSDSTHVKLKVLKLMKHIVEHGHGNFKLGLLKKSQGITDATKFSGPPHPLHGNTPYVMVRKTAKAISEMLFNTDTSIQASSLSNVQKTHIHSVGIGPSQLSQSASRSKMEGFGNTSGQPQSKTVGESIRDGLLKMADKLGDSTSNQQREVLSTIESSSNYTPPTDQTGRYTQPIYTSTPGQHTVTPKEIVKKPKHVPGRAGGGWEDSEDEDEFVPESQSTESNSLDKEDRLDNIADEDYSIEHNVVTSYVINNRVASLQRTQLKAFVKDCGSLNCDKVVEIIHNKLTNATDPDRIFKLLLLLEFLMTSDLVNLERLTSICRTSLVSVCNMQTGLPQSKARKLIRILEHLTSQHSILPKNNQTDVLVDA